MFVPFRCSGTAMGTSPHSLTHGHFGYRSAFPTCRALRYQACTKEPSRIRHHRAATSAAAARSAKSAAMAARTSQHCWASARGPPSSMASQPVTAERRRFKMPRSTPTANGRAGCRSRGLVAGWIETFPMLPTWMFVLVRFGGLLLGYVINRISS